MRELCQGAKVSIVIAPKFGYGEKGAGTDVPGGATLHYDVEVQKVSDKPILPPGLIVNQYDGPIDCHHDAIHIMDYVTLHYTGSIDESSKVGEKGFVFDSSRERDHPYTFEIGAGQVISGTYVGVTDSIHERTNE